MARDGRLWETEAIVEVAHAHLVVPEKGEDSQSRLVGQCLEQALQFVDRWSCSWTRYALHIFALTNLTRLTYIRNGEYEGVRYGRDQGSRSTEVR